MALSVIVEMIFLVKGQIFQQQLCLFQISRPLMQVVINYQIFWPRVNLGYHRADFARASFVNDARICGTNFWRDLTRARHLLMSREKVGNMTRIWRASKFLKFCPIFKILPDFQIFARFSNFCPIFKIYKYIKYIISKWGGGMSQSQPFSPKKWDFFMKK